MYGCERFVNTQVKEMERRKLDANKTDLGVRARPVPIVVAGGTSREVGSGSSVFTTFDDRSLLRRPKIRPKNGF